MDLRQGWTERPRFPRNAHRTRSIDHGWGEEGMSALLEQAKSAVAIATKTGASEVAAATYQSRDVEIGWRDGKIEKVSEATTRGLTIALYVDGRYSSVYTTDL